MFAAGIYHPLPAHNLDMLLFPLIFVYIWHLICAYGIPKIGVYIYERFHIAQDEICY